MDWLKRLFGILDKTESRVAAAGERIASAVEDMADQFEAVRDRTRERLGVGDTQPAVVIDAPEPQPAANGGGNGHARRKVGTR